MYKNTHKNRMIYKAVGLVLSLVMLLSAYMTGSYAWSALFNQENIFSGTQNPAYAAQLLKYERGADGSDTEIPVPGTPFYLYKITDDGRVQIGGMYLTDADGKIEVTDIAAGDYVFVEVTPVYGFDFNKDADGNDITEYPFSVNKDTPDGTITLAVYNPRILKDLDITKHVKNADGSALTDEQKDILFEFTVTLSDDGSYSYTIDGAEQPDQIMSGGKIYLKDGQTAVIKDLPVGLLYTVRETPVEDYSVSSSSHRGNITPEGASAEFINTYGLETEPDDTTLTIKKLVQGMGADPDKEFRFTVYIDGTLQTFTLKHGQTKTITLPIGARYEVYEDDYSPEYSQSSLGSGYGNAAPEAIEFTQINTYTGPVSYQPEVRKTVEGDTPEQPAEFTFELTAIGNAPLPGSGTVTITGQGEAKFGEIIFFSPGIYQYTIREITGSEPGYSYDEASYILTVEVEQSGSILLVKSVEYVNSATDEVCDAAEFINGYSPPETTTVTELTGTSTAKTSETTIATTPPENISTTSTSTSTGETTSATEPSTSVKTTDPTRVTGAETTDSTKGQTTTTAPEDGQTTTGSGKRQTTTPKDGYTTANSGKRQTTTAVPNNVFTTKQTLTTAPGGGKPGGSPGGSGYPDSKPVTGDTTGSMTVWFILMIVSAFGLRWTISRLQASKASARQRR